MVLVESKVHLGHKYLWNVDGGCFYSLLDELVSWSPKTKNNHLVRWESQLCIGKNLSHTTSNKIMLNILLSFLIFDFHDICRGRWMWWYRGTTPSWGLTRPSGGKDQRWITFIYGGKYLLKKATVWALYISIKYQYWIKLLPYILYSLDLAHR